jgi:hypothetical protein
MNDDLRAVPKRTTTRNHRVREQPTEQPRGCSCINAILGADEGCYNDILGMNDDDETIF